jgi:hypothetical protein
MVDEPDAAIADTGTASVADRASIDVSPQVPVGGIGGVIRDLGRLDRAVYGP